MPELSTSRGRYEIVREIGRGGMATVYLARQVELDRLVALKELDAFRQSDPSFAHRFLREARLAGSLSHPNIVTVHDFFEEGGTPVIAMEYLPRGSLRPYAGRLSLAQVGGILEGLLAGLAHAGTHGVVHRDLKPENLLISDEGRTKIADFGIAKATNDVQAGTLVTSTGIALGTPNYIAPEQAMADEVGPWTDLYGAGIVTFELFAGRAPFADTSEPMAVLLKHVNESVPALIEVQPGVAPAISEWVAWLVMRDPAARPQSAGQAWDALEDRLVGILGPRWRHDAVLPELGGERNGAAGPTATRTAAATVAPVAVAATQAPTVMPARNSWLGPRPEPAPRKHSRRWLRASPFALLALALVAWFAAQRAQDPPASGAGSPPSAAAPLGSAGTDAADTSTPGKLTALAPSLRATAARYETSARNVAAANAASPTPERAALVRALHDTGAAYRRAADAAARNDRPGYVAAVDEADASKARVDRASKQVADAARPGSSNETSTSTGSDDSEPASSAPAGPCSGDSSSDDPSDDDCEPEP
jgi:Protein kinase domain